MFATCCALLSLAAPSAPPSPNDLLAKMRKAYQAVAAVDFTLEISHQAYNLKSPLRVSFKRPMNVRVEATLSDGQKLISLTDGKIWMMIDNHGTPQKAPASESNIFGGYPVNLESLCLLYSNRELSTGKGGNMATSQLSVQEKSAVYILKEIATRPPLTVFYEIDKKTHLIMRTTVFNQGAQKPASSFKITKMDLKPKFSNDHFAMPR